MFRCQITGKMSQPNEKCNKVVVASRDKIYRDTIIEDNQEVEVEVGRGWEIVKEINASQKGLEIWEAMTDDERKAFVSRLK